MINKLRETINSCFLGKEEVTENVLICLLTGGHVLLEDVPGVGKTTLARALSRAVDLSFGRIQFTPDTLPGDVTGLSVYNMKTGEFEYREGAIMRQLILADEINRTSPKTQASLLEAMAEGRVTVDGQVYTLPQPFMVIATQNSVEFLGTYPLPEAQMDRFMMRLSIGYPEEEAELLMTRNALMGKRPEDIKSVVSAEDILRMQEEAAQVSISDGVLRYMNQIIRQTREEDRFVMGASPRAMIHLAKASQARAYLQGRSYVKPDDVKAVFVHTLHHRLTLTAAAKVGKESVDQILRALILKVNLPLD